MTIKPSGVPYGNVQFGDLSVIDVHTEKHLVGGRLKHSVDLLNHLDIYQGLSWVRSICHTHSPYATAFAMVGMPIRVCCTEQADYFGGDIPCLPFNGGFKWLCPQFPLGEGPKGILLGNHGALTLSPSDDPRDAVKLAVALESIAKKFHLALQVGMPLPIIDEDVREYHDRYKNGYGQK